MDKIKLFNLGETSNPDIFRYLNYEGDWTHYFIKSENKYVPAVNKILTEGLVKGYGFYNYLLSVSKEEAERVLETTGERGSRLHTALRMGIEGQPLYMETLLPNNLTGKPEKVAFDEWQAIMAMESFCKAFTPNSFFVEKTVASSKLGFAGTIDWVANIFVKELKPLKSGGFIPVPSTDGKGFWIKVLLDFKTGSGIYLHHKCQVSGYYALENDKSITHTGILRLGTDHKNGQMDGAGYELKLYDNAQTKKHFEIFLCAKQIHDLESGEFEENLVVIPTVIKLNIPKFKEPEAKPIAKAKGNSKGSKKVKKQNVTKQLSDAGEAQV